MLEYLFLSLFGVTGVDRTHSISILLRDVDINVAIAREWRWLLLWLCRYYGGRRREWSGQYIDNSQTEYATYNETADFVCLTSFAVPLHELLKREKKEKHEMNIECICSSCSEYRKQFISNIESHACETYGITWFTSSSPIAWT